VSAVDYKLSDHDKGVSVPEMQERITAIVAREGGPVASAATLRVTCGLDGCAWTIDATPDAAFSARNRHRLEAHGVKPGVKRPMRPGQPRIKMGLKSAAEHTRAMGEKARALQEAKDAKWGLPEEPDEEFVDTDEIADTDGADDVDDSVEEQLLATLQGITVAEVEQVVAEVPPAAQAQATVEPVVARPRVRVGRKAAEAWPASRVLDAIRTWAAEHDGPPTSSQWNVRHEGFPTYREVIAACGSWPDAIEQAGFPRPQQGGDRGTGGRPKTWTRERIVTQMVAHHVSTGRWPTTTDARASQGILPSPKSVRDCFDTWSDAVNAARARLSGAATTAVPPAAIRDAAALLRGRAFLNQQERDALAELLDALVDDLEAAA